LVTGKVVVYNLWHAINISTKKNRASDKTHSILNN
jgi:hypothetical protein